MASALSRLPVDAGPARRPEASGSGGARDPGAEHAAQLARLTGGIAHALRNPLFGVSATLDAFEAIFPPEDEQAAFLTVMREAIARVDRVIADVAELGRPTPSQRVVVPMSAIVGEAIAAARAEGGRDGAVVLAPSPNDQIDAAMAEVDRPEALRAIAAIVGFAIRAAEGRATFVAVDLVVEGERARVVVAVEAEIPEDLFAPFAERHPAATGLELAIAKKIVLAHGGSIDVVRATRDAPGAVATGATRSEIATTWPLARP